MLYSRLISRVPLRADRPLRFPFRSKRMFAFRPASAAHKVPDIRPIADTIRRRRVRAEKKVATRGECITRRVSSRVALPADFLCLSRPSPSALRTPFRRQLGHCPQRGGDTREIFYFFLVRSSPTLHPRIKRRSSRTFANIGDGVVVSRM